MTHEIGMATLVAPAPEGLPATQEPVVLWEAADGSVALTAHVGRTNPHWSGVDRSLSLALLRGPGAPSRGVEKVGRQAHSLRHTQMLNPSKGPDWGLFSFCFKGRWQSRPPFGDWPLDANRVSEWPASLFERPSTVTGRCKAFMKFQ